MATGATSRLGAHECLSCSSFVAPGGFCSKNRLHEQKVLDFLLEVA